MTVCTAVRREAPRFGLPAYHPRCGGSACVADRACRGRAAVGCPVRTTSWWGRSCAVAVPYIVALAVAAAALTLSAAHAGRHVRRAEALAHAVAEPAPPDGVGQPGR